MTQVPEGRVAQVDSTLSKGRSILEAPSASSSRQGPGVFRDPGMTGWNVHCPWQSLTNPGCARPTPDRTYGATLQALQIGCKVVENLSLRWIAPPHMKIRFEETVEMICLAVWEGIDVVFTEKIESRKPIRSWIPIGGMPPLRRVETGKAILAAECDRMGGQVRNRLTRSTGMKITSVAEFEADMERTRRRGHSVDRGEFHERDYSLGSGIMLPNGETSVAPGVSAPDINLGTGGVERIGARFRNAPRAVSNQLR